jgi:hypothetical protein
MVDESHMPDVFDAGEEEDAGGGVFDDHLRHAALIRTKFVGSDTLMAGHRQ